MFAVNEQKYYVDAVGWMGEATDSGGGGGWCWQWLKGVRIIWSIIDYIFYCFNNHKLGMSFCQG